jgi:phage protein D
MSEGDPTAPVNLNRARKEKARAEAKARADANAAKFGRTKAERVLAATRADKARRLLDQHRRDED